MIRVKLVLVVMMLGATGLSAEVWSQADRMTVKSGNVSMEELFGLLQKQTQLTFVYNHEEVRPFAAAVDAEDKTLAEILDMAFRDKPLRYTLMNEYVVISLVRERNARQPAEPVVAGRVANAAGEPLAGVAVYVKGTTRGTATDNNGTFRLAVPSVNPVLVFSYIGKQPVEIAWNGRDELNVTMQDAEARIDEVVVTGYQTLDRRKSPGSVFSTKMDDLRVEGATSVDQMLEGRIPDMVFMNNSGEVGVAPKLRVRGTSTLIGNREPLWVVDGVVVRDPVPLDADVLNDPDYVNRIGNAIAGINPQDIDRIDVLKDAAATTLYGVKAANGVIVVTTKKGAVGDPVINYNGSVTFRQRPRYTDHSIDLMNSKERIGLSRELVGTYYEFPRNMSIVGYEGLLLRLYNGEIDDAQFESEVRRLETVNTDWFDLLTADSFSHQHTVSVSGGSTKSRYYASLGYTRDNDVIKGAFNERYTAAVNLDINLTQKLIFSVKVNANVSAREYAQGDINPMDYAYNASRAIPAYDEDGEYEFYKRRTPRGDYLGYNVLNELANSYVDQASNAVTAQGNFRYQVTDYLDVNAQFSYSASNATIEGYWGEKTWYAASERGTEYGTPGKASYDRMPLGGELSTDRTGNRSYDLRVQANLNKSFGTDYQHNLIAALGYEMSSSRYDGYSDVERGYYADRGKKFSPDTPLDQYPAYAAWVAANTPRITDNLTNQIGAYASASYTFRNLFTLNANMRYDGSNKFGSRSNDKLLPTWSVAGNYHLSEHAFMQADFIDFITLKVSYGFQGNMLDGQTPVMLLARQPLDAYYGEMASTVYSYANPKLRWERTGSLNTGVEFSLFDRRVQVSAEYYRRRTKDAYMEKPISTVNGQESYVVNSGTIRNNGFNVALTVTPVRTADFSWLLSSSYSRNYNTMETLPGQETYELSDFLNGTALVKGRPVGTFYSYRFMGLSPVDGGPLIDDWEDRRDALAGLSKYETYTRVLKATGRREPYISGNIYNTLRWRNWRMGITLAYSLGKDNRLFGLYQGATAGTTANEINPDANANRVYLKRWRKPGDELHTNIPGIMGAKSAGYSAYSQHYSTGSGYSDPVIARNAWDMYDYSDLRVVSGDYMKLSNLSLTHSFDKKLIERMGMSRAEVTLSATNLFTICSPKLKGQAPTQSGFAEVQLSERPTYTFTLSLSF